MPASSSRRRKTCSAWGSEMFTDFLYLLRAYGLAVSLVEWSTLMDALALGLERESLLEFYHMARAILVKRESDYDRFDQAFAAYFKHLADSSQSELSEAMETWLKHVLERKEFDKVMADFLWKDKSLEEIEAIMRQRLREQKEEHHGGSKWIGTGGITPFGHSGYAPKGIRIRGKGMRNRALKVAEERNYRDFRDDHVLAIRQFQVALRKLRRLSNKDEAAATELDVDRTIEETGKHAGMLQVVMKKPRKNHCLFMGFMAYTFLMQKSPVSKLVISYYKRTENARRIIIAPLRREEIVVREIFNQQVNDKAPEMVYNMLKRISAAGLLRTGRRPGPCSRAGRRGIRTSRLNTE